MAGAFVTAYVGGGTTAQESSGSCTVSGATANNFLVATVVVRNAAHETIGAAPTGWTLRVKQENDDTVADSLTAVYTRVASGDTSDNFGTISWGSLRRWAIIVAEYSGADATTPYEDSAIQAPGGPLEIYTTVGTGSATATSANGFYIAGLSIFLQSDDTYTLATGTVDYSNSGGVNADAAYGHYNYSSAGSKSDTWSWSTADNNTGFIITLKPSVIALLADDVESASELSAPSVGQEHALLANDVESASDLTAPVLWNGDVLYAASVESATEVTSPVLAFEPSVVITWAEYLVTIPIIKTLNAEDVESATEVSYPIVRVIHSLHPSSISSATTTSSPSMLSWSTVDDSQSSNWVEIVPADLL